MQIEFIFCFEGFEWAGAETEWENVYLLTMLRKISSYDDK
jgi:hypothetical protein